MISQFIQLVVGDLANSKDGSISLTRLAALTAHANAAIAFLWITISKGFIAEMWVIYLGATIVHAGYDKTLMILKGNRPQ